MVEWWTSPNDLAQRVTTALYHQINRTKRPGWIRGDTFDIEKSLAEIVALSDRNRVLEDVNKSLLVENQKLKLRPERNPELIVSFSADTDANNKDDPLYGREKCISTDDAMRIHLTVGYVDTQKIESNYQPISKGDFIGELHERVTDEEIQKYNASLPSKETVKSYAKEYRHYHMIVDHGIASVITIHNVGTAKATDVSASLEFPEEIQVYSIDDVREIEEPEAPSKPRSLQRVAYERAHKTEIALERACTQLATPFTGSTYSWPSISNAVLGNTAIESVEVIDNTVEIETKHSIVHTKCYWFDGIYLVPMRKGVYEAKLTIMCAEYENPDENTITFVCE